MRRGRKLLRPCNLLPPFRLVRALVSPHSGKCDTKDDRPATDTDNRRRHGSTMTPSRIPPAATAAGIPGAARQPATATPGTTWD
ncbi:hypothetical protein Skr01_28670 [Sphaerisporangium krabiense]|nr:hypothetical protein Skr01_28670 [Sphaerisporangium krabiense]